GGWINNVIKTFRVFKATSDPFTVIVMEDLELTGYQMKECNAGLSQQDCENVLEKLAKFHAASVVYYEQNGSYPDDFKEGMFSDGLTAEFEQYYVPLFDSYLQALEELRYPAQIIESLKPMRGKVFSKTSKLFKLDPTKFNVLNHGDVWVNNIQFSDRDLLLLDYQISFYGSPSFDLLYFIVNSASLAVRTEKFDHLIDHYHQHLVEGMQRLNAKTPIPTRRELHEDIQAHGFLVCVLSMETLALMLAMPDLELKMDLLGSMQQDGVEYRKQLFTNDRFIKTIEKLMPFMWEKGFLVDEEERKTPFESHENA
ncbi:AAEL006203-PA, partial [Aedes aegypti]